MESGKPMFNHLLKLVIIFTVSLVVARVIIFASSRSGPPAPTSSSSGCERPVCDKQQIIHVRISKEHLPPDGGDVRGIIIRDGDDYLFARASKD